VRDAALDKSRTLMDSVYPSAALRGRLCEIGIPLERHDMQSLGALVVLNLGHWAVRGETADTLAETILALASTRVLEIPEHW
jgi:hypothetical protein